MKHPRSLLLAGLVLITVGSLAGTLGYAWYLRSERYRQYCADYLSTWLGLPSDIGRVVPRSWSVREFDDVVVWLPGRRDKALSCRRALVIAKPSAEDPEAYEIELLGGTSEISSRTWLREDVRRVLESGLRPGFDPAGPRRVKFSGMNLRFERGDFQGELSDAVGVVEFETAESGWAAIHCRALNDYVSPEPVALTARFSPQPNGIQIDALTLRVPTLPLHVLHLERLLSLGLRSGAFSGELRYSEANGHRRTTLSGRCTNLDLAECTARLLPTPWRGKGTEIELRELTLEDGRPQRLRFAGVLDGLVLGDVLAPWGLQGLGGKLTLRVRAADLSRAGIERLIASGRCENIALDALTRQLGWGRMSGTARLVIDDLTIEQNHLRSLDAEFIVTERAQPEWLEGRLLTNLVSRLLGTDLPDVLPERIEYTHLGFRLDVRDELLYVFGTHGPREKTILTARLFGQELPLLVEPEEPFELAGWLDQWRARALAYLEKLNEVTPRQTWEALRRWPTHWWPATRPAPPDATRSGAGQPP